MKRNPVDNPGRRVVLKSALAAAGAGIAVPAAIAKRGSKPAATPFVEPLPIPPVMQPRPSLLPVPTEEAAPQEAGRNKHQGWQKFPPRVFYESHVRPFVHSFHPDLPAQEIWGFDEMFPGPTMVLNYGSPTIWRIYNDLPQYPIGFGSPEMSIHVHNAHTPSESDGFPADYFSRYKYGPGLTRAGLYKDHHYPGCYSNYTENPDTNGDATEGLGTLWYHDHRLDFTAANVYKGLAGFVLFFDDIDSGNERDTNPKALRLPSGVGEYDIPLMLEHKHFDSSGYLEFDQFDTEGDGFGNEYVVNGKIRPYFEVARRKYRFRLLNASLTRFFEFYIVKGSKDVAFDYIANDGNLLGAPLKMTKVRLGPAERGDIVVDFSQFEIGDELFLIDRVRQDHGRGPLPGLDSRGEAVMRINVVRDPAEPDVSRVPGRLRAQKNPDLGNVRRTRQFEFDRENDVWTVNGKLFDETKAQEKIKLGEAEIWELEGKGSWHHPIHIHLEEMRILSRNGMAPPPHERGRKDVVVLAPGEVVRVYLRFTDFIGKHVMHCHNLLHEDHHMMLRFDVIAGDAANPDVDPDPDADADADEPDDPDEPDEPDDEDKD